MGLEKKRNVFSESLVILRFLVFCKLSFNGLKNAKSPVKRLSFFAVWTGLEPATPCVTGRYSNQLNYQTVFSAISDYRYSGIRKTCALLRDNKSTCFFEFCKTKRKVSRKICKRWLDYLWVQFPSLVGYVYRAFKMRN